ncbi:unnamed protein product [Clonostachys chloroleuca]|uniref:Uncharacterized protein n=1 Tax=Clonostachys chloroleuca TaxID=1926264 RepID=A0AA35PSS2_9HYPO|nr:unnamed protein product [Clonostachys chloroleuca]
MAPMYGRGANPASVAVMCGILPSLYATTTFWKFEETFGEDFDDVVLNNIDGAGGIDASPGSHYSPP